MLTQNAPLPDPLHVFYKSHPCLRNRINPTLFSDILNKAPPHTSQVIIELLATIFCCSVVTGGRGVPPSPSVGV